jgi:hypothetical protein
VLTVGTIAAAALVAGAPAALGASVQPPVGLGTATSFGTRSWGRAAGHGRSRRVVHVLGTGRRPACQTRAAEDRGAGMRVELLHHPGCRSAQAAHQLVEACLLVLGISIPVLVRVGDYPSPTVLVNGTDVMRPSATPPFDIACRIDVPTRDRLLATLTAHLTNGS